MRGRSAEVEEQRLTWLGAALRGYVAVPKMKAGPQTDSARESSFDAAMRSLVTAVTALSCLLAGCASFGPPSVERDRFDYVSSISESWKRQLMLNLLKVRYADAPVFIDVTSVISSYELQGQVNLGRQISDPGRGDDFMAFGATGTYADRPTITYSPLQGDKFAKSMMTPIPVSAILLLVQGGYPADVVLRVTVNSITGLENSFGGAVSRPGEAGFFELLHLLREAQLAGELGLQSKLLEDRQGVVMLFRSPKTQTSERQRRIAELLGIDPSLREFTVSYGTHPSGSSDIALQSRSMLQVLSDVASYIDAPAVDITEGRTYVAQRGADAEGLPPLLRVRHASKQPDNAYIAVRYRNTWFSIDDRDFRSKALFNFLLIMFSLTETGVVQAAPVVTVPTR